MSVDYHYGQFPPQNIDQEKLQEILSQARTELGRFDGLLSAISNPKVLLSPLFSQEAVLSSRIEGTQSSLSEVLEFEADEKSKKFSSEKIEDIKEIINYRLAIQKAIKMLSTYPLCQRVILESHKVLMDGVRGQNKSPGAYRKIPNWIGSKGEDINSARFVPLSAEQLPQAMSLWEKYIHEKENPLDLLIQIAVLHAEFEALHPFLDGNGRLGRMFIPLYLWKKKLIQSPSFYMSAYFERNRQNYYNLLLSVSRDGAWTEWCRFFLQGLKEESQNNYRKAKEILNLYNELKGRIPAMTKSQYGIAALDYLFNTPYFQSTQFYTESRIPKPTAQRLLKVLTDEKILFCRPGRGRIPSFYHFPGLLNIADGR